MVKQLRIDFPDYSAKEQELDAKRSLFRQVYLMKIDGKWGHYTIVDGKEDYDFHKGDLTETYNDIKAEYPRHRVRVIQNKGLEDYLRDMIPQKKQQIDTKQLLINFNEGR